jgi:hypothetical protein
LSLTFSEHCKSFVEFGRAFIGGQLVLKIDF